MINHVTLVGRLVRDPEIKISQTGTAVTKFTVACDRYKSETDFIRVVVFGKQAESAADYLEKGKMVGIVGDIKTGSYEDKEGRKVFTTDVVAREVKFLSPKSENQERPERDDFVPSEDDEDLPF